MPDRELRPVRVVQADSRDASLVFLQRLDLPLALLRAAEVREDCVVSDRVRKVILELDRGGRWRVRLLEHVMAGY